MHIPFEITSCFPGDSDGIPVAVLVGVVLGRGGGGGASSAIVPISGRRGRRLRAAAGACARMRAEHGRLGRAAHQYVL